MNFLCKIDDQIFKVNEIKNKHLKLRFEMGERDLLVKIPSLTSLTTKRANVIAYIENDIMRFRINMINAI